MKNVLRKIITDTVHKEFPEISQNEMAFTVDATTNPAHGDYATNIAMQLTKMLRKNPKDIARQLAESILSQQNGKIKNIEVAGPGFINFFIVTEAFQEWLGKLLENNSILKSTIGKGKDVMVEFVSANPTGPLHIGHGRGAALGDSIAAVMEAAGYNVTREYYINDAGNQMDNLAKSIYSRYAELHGEHYEFPADGYKGDYIADIAKELNKAYHKKLLTMDDAIDVCKRAGIKSILADIDKTLRRFNVKMDNFFSETSLYKSGEIVKTLDKLKAGHAIYKKDNAVWLSTQAKGDDEDRVLVKSDGSYTYLTPDIAYHANKFSRGHELLVDVWGADHHGYIKRMETALSYLGYNTDCFDVVLVQMVNLVKDGQKISMSTRSGEFITLDWLIDEVGVDAARYFYNMRSGNSQFDFDVDLAKSRSNDNPVYYVQYAHARVKSLMVNAKARGIKIETGKNLDLLKLPAEKSMIKKMMEFTSILETAANYNEPHRIAYFLQDLASDFHAYYYDTVILDINSSQTTNARLGLCEGVAAVIKFGLQLLGVSAPERM